MEAISLSIYKKKKLIFCHEYPLLMDQIFLNNYKFDNATEKKDSPVAICSTPIFLANTFVRFATITMFATILWFTTITTITLPSITAS